MRFDRKAISAVAAGLLASLSLSGCCAGGDSTDLHDFYSGRSPCASCGDVSAWKEYAAATSGKLDCHCADPCATSPCSSPCAPAPCADPCGGQYTTVTERVCTHCETCLQVWVPPVKLLHPEPVCVRPACSQVIPIPAVCRTVKTCCDPTSCCGETKTTEVCIHPPSCHQCDLPPVTYTDMAVCDEIPGHWTTVILPAIYETVTHVICKPGYVPPPAPAPAPCVAPAAPCKAPCVAPAAPCKTPCPAPVAPCKPPCPAPAAPRK